MASGCQPTYEADLTTHDRSRKQTRQSTNADSLQVLPTGSNGNTTTENSNVANNATQGRMAFSESLGIIVSRPKFRRYHTVAAREATFTNWTKSQDIREMARAGFVFTGKEDITACFYCGINLKDWPFQACPWEQHAIARPECGHLLQCKGQIFVRSCLEGRGNIIDADACDVIDMVKLAITRNKEAVELAKEYITDEELLQRSVKRLIKDNLTGTFTATQLVRVSQELELEDDNSGSQEETHTDNEREESDDDIDLVETHRQLKEKVECKVCYDGIACIITLPCGHMVCCSQCISAMSRCAVCRSEIKGTIRAVMAV